MFFKRAGSIDASYGAKKRIKERKQQRMKENILLKCYIKEGVRIYEQKCADRFDRGIPKIPYVLESRISEAAGRISVMSDFFQNVSNFIRH